MKKKFMTLLAYIVIFVLATGLACNYPGDLGIFTTNDLDKLETAIAEPVHIETRSAVAVGGGTISPEGGKLVVEETGDLLDGFSISISGNSFTEPVDFTIAYLPIESHNLSPDLTLITPLIQIENGGLIASDFMEISLPCELGPEEFAMLFIVDTETGGLQPLPLVTEDSSHLVALTTHFSYLLGVKINKTELSDLDLKTGFVHGKNNWQFENIPTDLTPNGNCFGQVITALDYYFRNNGPKLFGTFDSFNNNHKATSSQPYDDRQALRLVAVVQDRLNSIQIENNYWMKVQNKQDHSITFYSIALALKVSKEPQLVFFLPASGNEGHAVIVYGKYNEDLYISDPNKPKSSYILTYNFSKNSFNNVRTNPLNTKKNVTFTKFYYMNKYDFLITQQMAEKWAAFNAGTIGQGDFPPTYLYMAKAYTPPESRTYDLSVEITNDYVFVDKADMSSKNWIRLFSSSPAVKFIEVYDEKGKIVSRSEQDVMVPVDNPAGNPYLITFWGMAEGWIDGQWITFQQSLTGNYHGGRCPEAESEPYRWELDIVQDSTGYVSGTLDFHDCPGGGAVSYVVSGTQAQGSATVTLKGVRTSGRGGLGESSAYEVDFTFGLETPLSPNFAP